MYNILKKITLKLIPKKVLFRYESIIRYFIYLKYKGNKFECNICKKKLSEFIELNNDYLCPRCGSISRTRRLYNILENNFIKDSKKILDFSPSRSLYRNLKKKQSNYISSDLSGDFISDVSYNIKNIECRNNKFDLIICYHVLEHIDDDLKAMKELNRILKKAGNCIIQTPFKTGEIYENNLITSSKEREIHFGQNDHVRIYSVDGLKTRLESCGFFVEVKNFNENQKNRNGFKVEETVLICTKV